MNASTAAAAAAASVTKAIKAYSYLRFSTPEQAQGDSYRRQTALAEKYAAEHGLELDNELRLSDEGVSAFSGANAIGGRLGDFLKAVQFGDVPRGSYLLIEQFDRLSRQGSWRASHQLSGLCLAGIRIVTLTDGKVYSAETMDADPMAFIWAVLVATRANEESEAKSRRIKEAWRIKYANALKGEASTRDGERIITRKAPAWLRREGGEWAVLQDRADVVRRIFALAAAGTGCLKIATKLNEDGVAPFRDDRRRREGAFWWRSSVRNILGNKAVIGTFVPYRDDKAKREAALGSAEAVEGYFPAIVDRETFDAVQALSQVKAPQDRKREPQAATSGRAAASHTLAGVAKCACCGEAATRIWKGTHTKPRLVCQRAKVGGGCRYNSVRLDAIEAALRFNLRRIIDEAPGGSEALRAAVQSAEDTLSDLQHEIEQLVEALARVFSPAVQQTLAAKEAEFARLRSRLGKLQADLGASTPASIKAKLAALRKGVEAGDPRTANVALRQLVSKVAVNFQAGTLALHWRAAEATTDVVFQVAPLDDAAMAEIERPG